MVVQALFVVSVLIGRPLAGVFARETYPFPPAVKASATFRRIFSHVSLAWGVYLLLRSAVRLLALSSAALGGAHASAGPSYVLLGADAVGRIEVLP